MRIRSFICKVTWISDTVPVINVEPVSVVPLPTATVVGAIMPVADVPFCVTVKVCPAPVHVPVSVWLTGAGTGVVIDVATGDVGSMADGAVGTASLHAADATAAKKTAVLIVRVT